MMFAKDFSEFEPWSGAVPTWRKIEDADKLDEFEELLYESRGVNDIPTETEINDLLWFDSDWVLEQLGIKDEDDEDES